MLQTTRLQYRHGRGAPLQFPALGCRPSEALLVTGPSGAGKTTLLHLLAGILRPEAGDIRIGDAVINRLGDAQLDRFRGQHTGIIYQQSHFIASLTVRDNLLLAARLAGKTADSARLNTLSVALGIRHLLPQYPARLSQGEQQRASIVRALLHRPSLILADEPTASLDDDNCRAVVSVLGAYAREAALVVVTHDSRLKSMVHSGWPMAQLITLNATPAFSKPFTTP